MLLTVNSYFQKFVKHCIYCVILFKFTVPFIMSSPSNRSVVVVFVVLNRPLVINFQCFHCRYSLENTWVGVCSSTVWLPNHWSFAISLETTWCTWSHAWAFLTSPCSLYARAFTRMVFTSLKNVIMVIGPCCYMFGSWMDVVALAEIAQRMPRSTKVVRRTRTIELPISNYVLQSDIHRLPLKPWRER